MQPGGDGDPQNLVDGLHPRVRSAPHPPHHLAAKAPRPVFVRFGKAAMYDLHKADTAFTAGKAITLREGLPSTVGEALLKTADFSIYVRDRSPFVRLSARKRRHASQNSGFGQ